MNVPLRVPAAWTAPLAFSALPLLCFLLLCGAPAGAQSPGALPTAPGAQRAISGGLTQAHASLPGGPGRSPLEPYLILWLLPLSGLLTAAAGMFVDRKMRELARRRQLGGTRTAR